MIQIQFKLILNPAKKLFELTCGQEDYQKACEIIKEMQPNATIKDYALEQANCPKCKRLP